MSSVPQVSVIIPAWKEGDKAEKLSSIFASCENVEVVTALVEGDSDTKEPTDKEITVVRSKKGRGVQMDFGTKAATGEIFVFLHADTHIDPASITAVRNALKDTLVSGGAYSLKIDSETLFFRLNSMLVNLRSRLFHSPYGDQVLFMTRDVYEKTGGFPDIPILEDLIMVRRLGRLGEIRILNEVAVTSSRKWSEEGALYTTLRNWGIVIAFKLGVNPEKLVKWYYPST